MKNIWLKTSPHCVCLCVCLSISISDLAAWFSRSLVCKLCHWWSYPVPYY